MPIEYRPRPYGFRLEPALIEALQKSCQKNGYYSLPSASESVRIAALIILWAKQSDENPVPEGLRYAAKLAYEDMFGKEEAGQ
jgi:hypothetical protein